MKIKIERIYGNVDYTIGIATIEGARFRCYTLERRSADHSNSRNKRNNHAVPCDTYDFKLAASPISAVTPESFLIKGYGHIRIVKHSSFQYLGTGDIAFFATYPDRGQGIINDSVYQVFEQLCYDHARAALAANLTARGTHQFIITESEDFVYDEAYHSALIEEGFTDTDFLEDADDEDTL